MRIGVPTEIKKQEYRVGLTPIQVAELTNLNHRCCVQAGAGEAIGFNDDDYQAKGAVIVKTAEEIYADAELVVKVKEPQPDECKLMRPQQCVFGYYHLAAEIELAKALQQTQAICIAYETVTDNQGRLPLLAPMSEVAGRMSVQAGIAQMTNPQGGPGMLLGGVPGVAPAKVVIIGGGVVGTQAARMAVGLGGDVTILDRNIQRLRELDMEFMGRVTTLTANASMIEHCVVDADLVIGAVLISGASAPKVLTRDNLKQMKNGAVVVDVAIDQGGCFETSKPTTHANPTYVVDGVIHYCVANIPGAVARTSTQALTNATFPFVLELANQGIYTALRNNTNLRNGLNVCQGQLTHPVVAQSLGLPYRDPLSMLNA
jgi:alanine dehydrogenase